MAFTLETFNMVSSGKNTAAPMVYAYSSVDDLAEVSSNNYFNDKAVTLKRGDILECITSLGVMPSLYAVLKVVSSSFGSVTTKIIGNETASRHVVVYQTIGNHMLSQAPPQTEGIFAPQLDPSNPTSYQIERIEYSYSGAAVGPFLVSFKEGANTLHTDNLTTHGTDVKVIFSVPPIFISSDTLLEVTNDTNTQAGVFSIKVNWVLTPLS